MSDMPIDRGDWFCEPIARGRAWKWISPAHDGWEIFEQPNGFFVWHRFTFCGEFLTFEKAKLRAERHGTVCLG